MQDNLHKDLVKKALVHWGFEEAESRFIAARENTVYYIDTGTREYALRIRRPGYRTNSELLSELLWLQAMSTAGLSVPLPQTALSGELLVTVDGITFDLVSWLEGKPLGKTGTPLQTDKAPEIFHQLGQTTATLHQACDDWSPPDGFERCHWDHDGLLGDAPLWGKFWENPFIDADARKVLAEFRTKASDSVSSNQGLTDYGLIHADLVRENVLIDGSGLRIIDFDDGGYGFRLFDIATALLKNMNEPDYEDLKSAFLSGYQGIRETDLSRLNLFIALRAATYLGWIVPRIDEPGAEVRCKRFTAQALPLCRSYLELN